MSLSPYDFDNFYRLNQDLFGTGLYGNQHLLWNAEKRPIYRSILSPWRHLISQLAQFDDLQKNMHVGTDGFQVKLDVADFKPEEIKVKAIDNSIIIEAKQDEKKDDTGSFSRHIVRRYDLPKEFKPEEVVSNLSSDGILTIKCPKAMPVEGALVREIKIEPTGPARLTYDSKQDDSAIDESKEKTEEKA